MDTEKVEETDDDQDFSITDVPDPFISDESIRRVCSMVVLIFALYFALVVVVLVPGSAGIALLVGLVATGLYFLCNC